MSCAIQKLSFAVYYHISGICSKYAVSKQTFQYLFKECKPGCGLNGEQILLSQGHLEHSL